MRAYRLHILAGALMRAHRPVCSYTHTKLVYARTPAGVHMAHKPADYNYPTTNLHYTH